MFDNSAFNRARKAAQIKITEFADFVGLDRGYAVRIENSSEPAGPWALAAIAQMVNARFAVAA